MTYYPTRRGLLVWTLASLAVIAPESFLLLAATDNTLPCVRAEQWVTQHAGALPTAYDDIIAFPMEYRKAIYSRLSQADRSGLWATQLEQAQVDGTALTAEQRQWFEELSTKLRGDGLPAADSAELDALKAKGTQLLGDNAPLLSLFTQLGPQNGRYGRSLSSTLLTLTDAVRQSVAVEAQSFNCNCSTGDDWCNYWYGNSTYWAWCEHRDTGWFPPCQITWGCGWFALSPCDGTCAKCRVINGEEFCGQA